MRVLLSSHGTSMFGAERVLLALAGGLVERGHHVTLELPHEGPALAAARELAAVRTIVSGRGRLPRNAAELLRFAGGMPADQRHLRRLIDASGCDVVWVNSIYNVPAALAARAAGIPAVWHLHERNFGGAAGMLVGRVVRSCSRVALAPSSFVAESFAGRGGPAALRVVPNALLRVLEPLPAVPGVPGFRVGYLGQFEPRKRAVDVVHALARVPGAMATLVGAGKAQRSLEAAIARAGVAERVQLTGFHEDIRAALDGCSCVVIPARDEPFGLVALEAMALGLPVIAARSGALPEVLGDAALYYPLADVAALAAAIERLRREPELRARLRERGLQRVHGFAPARMLDGVEAALAEVAA